MIVENFTVKGTNRYNELQDFMKTHLPDSSFRFSPVYNENTDCYQVSIRFRFTHALLLEELHAKWNLEDSKHRNNNRNSLFQNFLSQFISPTS